VEVKSMGELVAFRASQRGPRGGAPRSEGAEILFFTGVRYMRAEDYVEDRKASNHRSDKKRLPARDQAPH
jgi:hypothetical protein